MFGRRAGTAGGWGTLVIGCLAVAALSLLVVPRSIAYDPWSWIVWGREIAHLNLDTQAAATSVKPLPMVFTTIFAPAGSWAPDLWLLVARAATLLSLALAFQLGRRLGGVAAGVIAAVGLAVTDQYLSYLFVAGMSEPMTAAAVLAAADNHLQGRRRATLVCLVAAALLRPEAWFFLAAYCLWRAYLSAVWWQRLAYLALAGATPASWFVIDWFGSGQLNRSAGAAKNESQGGPLLSRNPGIATAREAWHLMSGPIVVLFVVGFAVALVALARYRRATPSVWLGIGAVGWLAVAALMAQARIATGAQRYLLPGVALAAVVAGVFVADLAKASSRWLRASRAPTVATLLAMVVVGAFLIPRFHYTGQRIHEGLQGGRRGEHLAANLPDAIALAGGRDAVLACGNVNTQPFQVPLVAWELRVAVGDVHIAPGATGTVLRHLNAPAVPVGFQARYRTLGSVGDPAQPGERWTVLTTCTQPTHSG